MPFQNVQFGQPSEANAVSDEMKVQCMAYLSVKDRDLSQDQHFQVHVKLSVLIIFILFLEKLSLKIIKKNNRIWNVCCINQTLQS